MRREAVAAVWTVCEGQTDLSTSHARLSKRAASQMLVINTQGCCRLYPVTSMHRHRAARLIVMGARWLAKALDAERLDWHIAGTGGDQLGHQGADAGAKLEAVRRKAELMEDALRGVARADDGNVVGHASFDAGPGTNDAAAGHDRKQLRHGAGAFAELVPVELGAVFLAKGTPKMAAADQDRTVSELLKRELATSQNDHWCNKGRHWCGDHQHGRDHLQWHRLSEQCGD